MSKRQSTSVWAVVLTAFWIATAVAQEEPATTKPGVAPAKPTAARPTSVHPMNTVTTAKPRVAFDISEGSREWGRIVIELDEARAPETVRNFLRYVDDGFYNGTIFHRVVKDFMIQGGGYRSTRQRTTVGLHPPIPCESHNGLKNLRGTIAMARAKDPQSATAQFFINVVDNPNLDYPGHDGTGYCVFGRVVEGMDIVDKIQAVPTRVAPELQRTYVKARRDNPNAPHPESSQPVSPPRITRAYRVAETEQPQVAATAPATPPIVEEPQEPMPPDQGDEDLPPEEGGETPEDTPPQNPPE